MTALEKILGQIGEEARQEAESLLADARRQADALLAQTQAQAEADTQAAREEARREAADVTARAVSAAQLKKRNELLAAKQALIAQTLERTRRELEEAPDEAYFAALTALFRKAEAPQGAVIRFNQRDLGRLPKGWLQAADPQGNVTLSPELSHGGVDVNGSFAAVFEAEESRLRDLCGGILFPPEA